MTPKMKELMAEGFRPAYQQHEHLAYSLGVLESEITQMVADGRLPPPIVIQQSKFWRWEDVKKSAPPPPVPVAHGYVYFIECGDFIKIGFSASWKQRVKSISWAIPYPCSVLLVLKGSIVFEAELHQQFASLAHRNEWFRKDAMLLSYIEHMKGHGE